MPWGILSFYNQYLFTILHGVYGAKKPGRPGPDNNQIVVFGSRQKLIPLAGFTYIIWLSSGFLWLQSLLSSLILVSSFLLPNSKNSESYSNNSCSNRN